MQTLILQLLKPRPDTSHARVTVSAAGVTVEVGAPGNWRRSADLSFAKYPHFRALYDADAGAWSIALLQRVFALLIGA